MKKFIICALFAWWFVTVGQNGDGLVVGPFDTKIECVSTKADIVEKDKIGRTGVVIIASDCWESRKDGK